MDESITLNMLMYNTYLMIERRNGFLLNGIKNVLISGNNYLLNLILLDVKEGD